MSKQFKNKEELDKWINEKDAEIYPERDIWDIEPCKMTDEEIISALIAEGYVNLDNLVEDGHGYEIAGHTNNGWLYKDEADLIYIEEMGLNVELRKKRGGL